MYPNFSWFYNFFRLTKSICSLKATLILTTSRHRICQRTGNYIFIFLGRRMRYRDAFQYASDNLLRRNVMIMNADCYVDKGFEQLDESILNNKTMYALTRHETPENVRLCNASDFCGPTATYIGSHDAFLFRLLVPLPSQLLDNIDYRPNILGIEQVLMFNFKKYVQFNVKNPCKILHVVHHHCSNERNETERTINGHGLDRYVNIKTKQG